MLLCLWKQFAICAHSMYNRIGKIIDWDQSDYCDSESGPVPIREPEKE